MPSPAFGLFFEIFSEGVVFTVALIASVCFGERCWKRSAPLNITGLAASLIAVAYSVFALEYWFNGLGDLYDCTTLAAVNGTCMSASNAFTFLHLFVKADASNQRNPKWRKFYRWVGVATTAFNWVTLAVVHALLEGTQVDGLDGPRCKFTFEMNSFRLKWIAQIINQAFQVAAFVGPLIVHLRMMARSPAKSSEVDTVFATLVKKALIASGVSLLFTLVVTVLAFTKMQDMKNGTNKYLIPVFPLAVLDNAVSLGAIIFAVHLPSMTRETTGRDKEYAVTVTGSNISTSERIVTVSV
ncbi:unnamed protein product [Ectocarpus sp. 12 AP-2014]